MDDNQRDTFTKNAQGTAESTESAKDAQYSAESTESAKDAQYSAGSTESAKDAQYGAGSTESAKDAQGTAESTESAYAQYGAESTEASEPTPEQTQKKKQAVRKEILEWVKSIAIALVIVFIIRTFLFTMIRVDGSSMLETLHNNDRLAVTIIDLKINGPQRNDIVICTYPGEHHLCIKRVIGMPGETLEIRNGLTYIDGAFYKEDYIEHPRLENFGPITLGEDEYFVMGDNRANSHDSRASDVGPLKRSMIGGKARLRVWPFSAFQVIE